MSKEKQSGEHTPGPWYVGVHGERGKYADGGQVWVPHGAISHCVVASANFHLPNKDANARLIAAAPDLLKALEDLVVCLNDCRCGDPSNCKRCQALRARRAAIERATGRDAITGRATQNSDTPTPDGAVSPLRVTE